MSERTEGYELAMDIVLLHLESAAHTWTGQPIDPGKVLRMTAKNVRAMRQWTSEFAMDVLAQAIKEGRR
jgi:hypothetical protein